MGPAELRWLPIDPGLAAHLRDAEAEPPGWTGLVRLAGIRPDLAATLRLDRLLRRGFPAPPPEAVRPVRLALLGSATLSQLAGPIRVAALRRGLHVTVHEGAYGQYAQELMLPDPELAAFRPDTVLLALDARHLAAGLSPATGEVEARARLEARLDALRRLWAQARALGATSVIQQAALPVLPPLMGQGEERLPGSPAAFCERLNAALREAARAEGVVVLGADRQLAREGLRAWHDPVRWHHAKQEVSGRAVLTYGDLVARVLAALQGRSAKVLVLDLDNTLWGGVVGDDGPAGLVLGQGSALGEAFAAVQGFARDLSRRGVLLAVCSKNDEANALAPFDSHPEMVLRREDIACFVANWDDKAANLRRIADRLSLGLDALVLLDDNPAERALVRRELPEVQVPELDGDDPAQVPDLLADAGYFEALALTAEDLARTAQYRANAERAAAGASATDLPGFLRSLEMRLVWSRLDEVGLARVVQLANKTNQFNLLTRRTTEGEVRALIADPRRTGLQLRLLDRFGDNGVVAVVTAALSAEGETLEVTDWLMSCRVLGRGVERATLRLLAAEARRLGARRLAGRYRRTPRNGMVAGLYPSLGFRPERAGEGEEGRQVLALEELPEDEGFMQVEEARAWTT